MKGSGSPESLRRRRPSSPTSGTPAPPGSTFPAWAWGSGCASPF